MDSEKRMLHAGFGSTGGPAGCQHGRVRTQSHSCIFHLVPPHQRLFRVPLEAHQVLLAKLLRWPSALLVPCLDLFRALVATQIEARRLAKDV